MASVGARFDTFEMEHVRLTLPFAPAPTDDGRYYHGGIVVAMLDTAGVSAFWASYDYRARVRASTVSLSTQFVGACDRSDLVCEAGVIKRGQDLVFTSSIATDTTGRVVTHGQQTYRIAPCHRPKLNIRTDRRNLDRCFCDSPLSRGPGDRPQFRGGL
jgi:acyl-coenzyme A thioesterase PaaI-like protein